MKSINRMNTTTINAVISHFNIKVAEDAKLDARRAAVADHFGDSKLDDEIIMLALDGEKPEAPKNLPAIPGKPSIELPRPAASKAESLRCSCGAEADLMRKGNPMCGPCAVKADIAKRGKAAYKAEAAKNPGQKVNRSHIASAFTWPVAREMAAHTKKGAMECAREVYQFTTKMVKDMFPDKPAKKGAKAATA